ncbi:MAG: hypothetical protein ABIH71_01945 [Candidatus Omnitrophota bacterium]
MVQILQKQGQLIHFSRSIVVVKIKDCRIIAIGIGQIVLALRFLYVGCLQFINKSRIIITIAMLLFSIHFLISAKSLLKLENPGRILSITNMLVLSIMSIGGMLLFGVGRIDIFLFWFMILCISIYCVLFLSSSKTKQYFKI